MKRRITREHDARQDYSAVYWEGGTAITDADLNAAFDVGRERDEALSRAFVAPAGSADDGWRASGLTSTLIDGTQMVDFDLGAGHYLLDGTMLRNPAPFAFTDQPHGLSASLEPDMGLAWPDPGNIPAEGRFDAVVIDNRTMGVGVSEDPELQEVAMRSDPATRVRHSPKVRMLTDVAPTCGAARLEAMDRLAGACATHAPPSPAIRPNGRLRVGFGPVTNQDNPCAPEQATGYFGRLNQTIKVMLTAPDRFVWAHRNGGEVYRATVEDATTLRVLTPFDDSSRFPTAGQIVEVLPWDTRLPNGEPTAARLGRFHVLATGYAPGTDDLTLATALDADLQDWATDQGTDGFVYLRFWQPPAVENQTSTATGADVPLADTGIRLDFTVPGCAGDQWTFSVRARTPTTVFPRRFLDAGGQPPSDIRRSADLIALIHWTVSGGVVSGHLHDCRRRVRPLWKQDRCCTITVGDGLTSFGDVDNLADAIAMLPHEGGRICLLPGTHQGPADLSDRHDVTLEGCRGQTRLARQGTDPVVLVEDAVRITIRDLAIDDGDGLAVAAARTTDLTLDRVDTLGRGSAISLVGGTRTRVLECRLTAEAEPAIVPPANYPQLRPLAYVGGNGLEIADCSLLCTATQLSLSSLGGLQIAGGSRDVRIARNVIAGGVGHGITLGHLDVIRILGLLYGRWDALALLGSSVTAVVDHSATWTANSRVAAFSGDDVLAHAESQGTDIEAVRDRLAGISIALEENPLAISEVAQQGCLGIDPTLTLPEPADDDVDWTDYIPGGSIRHIHILDNEIVGMGGSGIGMASWTTSRRVANGESVIEDLIAERNHIASCARVAVATSIPDDDLSEIGFGGIALEVVRGCRVAGNVIQGIGNGHRSPSVGIYLAETQTCQIEDNQILAIGRPETTTARTIQGVSGGIVIDRALPIWGPPVLGTGTRGIAGILDDLVADPGFVATDHATRLTNRSEGTTGGARIDPKAGADYLAAAQAAATQLKLPRTEALRIVANHVVVALGPSLDVRGEGSFHVEGNHLTALAVRPNPGRPRLSTSVSIVNTELPYLELAVFLLILLRATRKGDFEGYLLPRLVDIVHTFGAQRDRGAIQVQDNHFRTEGFIRGDDSLALVAVVSPFDVAIADTAMKSVHNRFATWMHLIGVGVLSTQVVTNRVETRPPNGTLLGSFTAGRDNTTWLNHSSHPMNQMRITPAATGTATGNVIFPL